MSRLYIRAQGNRGEVTRTAVDHATVVVLYNFDGGQDPDGSMTLTTEVSKDRKRVTYTLRFTNEHNGYTVIVGRWSIKFETPTEIAPPFVYPGTQSKLF